MTVASETESRAVAGSADDSQCSVGAGCVPRSGVVALLVLAVIATIVLVYTLVALWPVTRPAPAAGKTAAPQPPIPFFGLKFKLSDDARLFAIVAAAGAIGGMVHTLRSLSWYVGNRNLKWSWVPFYVMLPVIGATVGTVFYLVLRAGVFSPSTPTTEANAYGLAALAALVGLFSEQALEKLREVFSSLLAHAPQGSDASPPGRPNAATGAARVVSPTEAVLTGTVHPRGSDAQVIFVYGKTVSYDQEKKAGTVPAGSDPTTLEVTVTGLDPDSEYHFRIEATGSGGTAPGDDAVFRTPSGP